MQFNLTTIKTVYTATIGFVRGCIASVKHRRQQLKASRQYQFLRNRLIQYGYLCRLDKPIGIYLLLWSTLWAVFIAGNGRPDLSVLFVFITGVILMRSAGCAINDFADRNIDKHVKRTQGRPLAVGTVSPREAIGVFIVLSLAAFGLVLLMNKLTIYLSLIGALLAACYPFAKRYTYMPQVVLGAAFGWAVPMAFAAQTGEIPVTAWLLFITTVVWATAYDTMYAMVDREDDLKIGVKSTAILFGEADVLITMFLQAMVITALVLVGNRLNFGLPYFLGVAMAVVLIVYQYFLIRNREPDKCFQAFLNNNAMGFFVFFGIVAHYLQVMIQESLNRI